MAETKVGASSNSHTSSRADRNLREQISIAANQLKHWRADGDATKIAFWVNRLNDLIDHYIETTKVS